MNRPYQGVKANIQELIKELIEKENELEKSNDNNKDDVAKEKLAFKYLVKNKLLLWSKAASINKTYRRCYEDKTILIFSHRLRGWSNPVFQLTPNFSVEIKTNFGYGNSSYFEVC